MQIHQFFPYQHYMLYDAQLGIIKGQSHSKHELCFIQNSSQPQQSGQQSQHLS